MNKKTLSLLFTLVVTLLYIFFEENLLPQKSSFRKHNEKHYQSKMCNALDGKMEVVLKDKTRIDCLTAEYAIEVDFAKKGAEGIGQALY